MKKHVPFLLSLLSIMGLLAWTISVRAQCSVDNVIIDIPVNGNVDDQSAYQHAVTIAGATYAVGENGDANGSVSFNGNYDAVTIPYSSSFLSLGQGFTIAAWINPSSFLSYNTIASKLNGSHRDFVFRYHNDGKLQLHYTNSGNSISAVTTDAAYVATNVWQHVAATWDGTNMRLYVDGLLVKEMTLTEGPTIQSAGGVQFGRMTSSERAVGLLDDMQIRSYAVAEDDMPCLMNHSMPIDQGLVLSLPLDGNGTDVSSYAHSGTVNGAIAAADRFMNSASSMIFAGSQNVSITNQSQYNALGPAFTISAWVRPTSVTGVHTFISKVGTGRDVVLRVDDGRFTVHYYVGGYVWIVPATATVSANEWTNLACSWDGTTMRLYQDAVEIYSMDPSSAPTFTSNPWAVGALSSSGGEGFGGAIDDVNVWSRALAPCELEKNLYPAVELINEDNLTMCLGETQSVSSASMCTYLWTNDNSTSNSFTIDADELGVGDHVVVLEAYDSYDNFYSDTVHVSVSLCTGIQESQNTQAMKLMPNPTSHSVTVTASGLIEVQLSDLSGRLIKKLTPTSADRMVIEVADLPRGIYLVTAINTEGTVQIEKLMKH